MILVTSHAAVVERHNLYTRKTKIDVYSQAHKSFKIAKTKQRWVLAELLDKE